MLIISRRIGETVTIGDEIAIKILGVRDFQVRIGVKAPRETEVHREEIYKRIQEEKHSAQDSSE